MSIKIMSKIWECGPDAQADCFVLLALADFANDAGECWPSIETVAKKVRMKERGVRQIIRRLEADGWLQTVVGGGRHGCNNYRINPAPHAPLLADKPGTTCPPAPHAPRHETTETRHETTRNPAPHAPEPSRTVNNHQAVAVCAREVNSQDWTPDKLHGAVMQAVGLNDGRIPAHWMPPAAPMHVWRWVTDLGISPDVIIDAAQKNRQQHDDPPNGPKALDGAMKRISAQIKAPAMKPAQTYSPAKPDEAASKLARYNRRAGANQ